jgi:hypothetical protein
LLALKLEVKRPRGAAVRRATGLTSRSRRGPDGAQGRLSHRPGPPGAGLDEQELFLDTHTANSHYSGGFQLGRGSQRAFPNQRSLVALSVMGHQLPAFAAT